MHLVEQGCVNYHMEVVHVVANCKIPMEARAAAIENIIHGVADSTYLHAFSTIAPSIKENLMNKLDRMGDVAGLSAAHATLRARCDASPHWIPNWFPNSLFIIAHQLRFRFLQSQFAEERTSYSSLWEMQDEDTLELQLQKLMPQICENLGAIWVAATMPDAAIYQEYLAERALVPRQLLQFVGCYANEPTTWNWNDFPFRKLGTILNEVLVPGTSMTTTLKHFKEMWPNGTPCGQYSLTHKVRTLLSVQGKTQSCCATSWYSAQKMSPSNNQSWQKLGSPSVEDFWALMGKRSSGLDYGFKL